MSNAIWNLGCVCQGLLFSKKYSKSELSSNVFVTSLSAPCTYIHIKNSISNVVSVFRSPCVENTRSDAVAAEGGHEQLCSEFSGIDWTAYERVRCATDVEKVHHKSDLHANKHCTNVKSVSSNGLNVQTMLAKLNMLLFRNMLHVLSWSMYDMNIDELLGSAGVRYTGAQYTNTTTEMHRYARQLIDVG